VFGRVDSNGDGAIDRTEFDAMAQKMERITGRSIDGDRAMGRLDTNEDGSLDQQEVESGFMEMLGRMRSAGPPAGLAIQFDSTSQSRSLIDLLGVNANEEDNQSLQSGPSTIRSAAIYSYRSSNTEELLDSLLDAEA
jgi:hypothetical protein